MSTIFYILMAENTSCLKEIKEREKIKMYYLLQWMNRTFNVIEAKNIRKKNRQSVQVLWYGKTYSAKIIAMNSKLNSISNYFLLLKKFIFFQNQF